MKEQRHEVLEKYGVKLKRLTPEKLELVRYWRNHPKISRYMAYREEITPEMQQRWFRSVDNDNNFYYIIEYRGEEIGLINIRDIDYDKKTGEPGIFIWEDSYLETLVPIAATYCLGDFYFEELGLVKTVIHILNDNPRAIHFNKSQGYKLSPGQEREYNQEYSLEADVYFKKRNKIVKYLNSL